jgi:hypothetical protein
MNQGTFREGAELLIAVSNLTRTFSELEQLEQLPRVTELTDGSPMFPSLLCLATSENEYARIAATNIHNLAIGEVVIPGFRGTELPESIEVAAKVLTKSLNDYCRGKRLVLVGHSISCGLAVKTAGRLKEMNVDVTGLILLDPPDNNGTQKCTYTRTVLAEALHSIAFEGRNDNHLIAIGRYLKLQDDCETPAFTVPSLTLKSKSPGLDRPQESVPLLNDEAALTALQIGNWLNETENGIIRSRNLLTS